ncbi:MAG: alpha/beta hydrolase [Pseudomonadota bacterium]
MITTFDFDCFWRIKDGGDKGTLFYIHGLGESGRCFEHLMDEPQLSEWYHIAPDLPGYGKSLWTQHILTLQQLAQFLADFIQDTYLPKPIIIIGHSMGGVIGTLLSAMCDDIDGFVNIEGNLTIEDCQFSSRASVYSKSEFITRGYKELSASIFELAFANESFKNYFVSLSICDPSSYYQHSQELIDISARESLLGMLEKLPIPTIYFAGIPQGISDRSLVLLKDTSIDVVKITLSGHWPFQENPKLFISQLKKFMGKNQEVI